MSGKRGVRTSASERINAATGGSAPLKEHLTGDAHIGGIVESALYVQDVARSAEFYSRVLGFPVILDESRRLHALAAGDRQVLLLFQTGASAEAVQTPRGRIPGHDGRGTLHVAFAIGADEIGSWRERLGSCGVAVESEVDWPRGGHSIYFRDPDGHLVELVSPGCWSVY